MNKFIDTTTLKKNSVIINQVELEEILEKRIVQMKMDIRDLFLVVNTMGDEVSLKIETKYGKLLCFCVKDAPKNLLLHHTKYSYPKIEKTSSRMMKKLGNSESHLIH
jgi:hypothetical protein